MADYKEIFAAAKKENPGLSDKEITEGLKANGVTEPGLVDKVNAGLKGARDYVGKGLKAIDTMGGLMPGGGGGMIPSELVNPMPGSLGDAAALGASLVAGGATRGAAGVSPSLLRAGAPVAAGAAGDIASGSDETLMNTILRGVAGLGAESVSGVIGAYRRIRGASRLQEGDVSRVSEAVSIPNRKVQGTTEDLALAGEGKPHTGPRAQAQAMQPVYQDGKLVSVGVPKEPMQTGSLEGAADSRYKNTLSGIVKIVGDRARFKVPSNDRGPEKTDFISLQDALDDAAGLRNLGAPQGQSGAHGGQARATAQITYEDISKQLRDQGLGKVADILVDARRQLAQDMSKSRLISDAQTGVNVGGKPLEGVLDPASGKLDMSKLQQRLLQLRDAGSIDPDVSPGLTEAAQRGGRQPGQPLTDQKGEFKLPFLRFGAHGVTAGEGLGSIVKARLPKFVGTKENLKAVAPVEGLPRVLGSFGAVMGAQNAREALQELPPQ